MTFNSFKYKTFFPLLICLPILLFGEQNFNDSNREQPAAESFSHQKDSFDLYFYKKIDGVDQDWIFQSEDAIQLNELPYGEHTLRLSFQETDGTRSAQEFKVPILILKPFYFEMWFWLPAVLFIGGLLAFAFRYPSSSKAEEEIVKEFHLIEEVLKKSESAENPTFEPSVTQISEEDKNWLIKCENHLKKQINNPNYKIAQMATDLAMSESSLTRQLKRLTGFTPARYLKELRLKEARILLEDANYKTIAQVAYEVGFLDAKAFTRSFKKRYGKSPSEIVNT